MEISEYRKNVIKNRFAKELPKAIKRVIENTRKDIEVNIIKECEKINAIITYPEIRKDNPNISESELQENAHKLGREIISDYVNELKDEWKQNEFINSMTKIRSLLGEFDETIQHTIKYVSNALQDVAYTLEDARIERCQIDKQR